MTSDMQRMSTINWQPMSTAPRDNETPVLLFTTDHGIVQAWFSPGQWYEHQEGRDYEGAVWVCGDDAFQIEVEEYVEAEGAEYPFHDGTAKAWAEMPNLPDIKDIT